MSRGAEEGSEALHRRKGKRIRDRRTCVASVNTLNDRPDVARRRTHARARKRDSSTSVRATAGLAGGRDQPPFSVSLSRALLLPRGIIKMVARYNAGDV